MDVKKRMSELLVKTGAFKDLDKPVILASGELGIYFINAEKLCMDGGEFEKFGDDSEAMAEHAFNMTKAHPEFDEVISILAAEASAKLSENHGGHAAISGGQRRDWLFSAPVAFALDLPHISLYKDGRSEMLAGTIKVGSSVEMNSYNIVHIVDMITEGSSIYRVENDVPKGWVPMIQNMSTNPSDSIRNVLAVVTRNQGGEQNLAAQGVDVASFVSIDEAFLRDFSKNPEEAIKYFRSPKDWSQNYLSNQDTGCLVKFFDPKGKSLDKANKFVKKYGVFMSLNGSYDKLDKKVSEAYGAKINDIIGGR